MIEKLIAIFIVIIFTGFICLFFAIGICIACEFSNDIADWIREKVFKKKRGAK